MLDYRVDYLMTNNLAGVLAEEDTQPLMGLIDHLLNKLLALKFLTQSKIIFLKYKKDST